MCTQDVIFYRCTHFSRGENHPCQSKQEHPEDACTWEAHRRLELRQQCKKCTTRTVDRRNDSDWSYSNNEEYQRRTWNRFKENEEEKKEHWPNTATNFAVKLPQSTQPELGLGLGLVEIIDVYGSEGKEIGLIDLAVGCEQVFKEKTKKKQENRHVMKDLSDNTTNLEVKRPAATEPEIYRAVAMHRFHSDIGEDCFFEKGDQISIFRSVGKDWWWGVNLKTMAEGLLPKAYVTLLNSSLPKVEKRVEKETFPPYSIDVGEALLNYINK